MFLIGPKSVAKTSEMNFYFQVIYNPASLAIGMILFQLNVLGKMLYEMFV